MSFSSKTNKSYGVYFWGQQPRIARKSGSVKNALQMPKGQPKRIEAYDKLNVGKFRVGLRHSAIISQDGELYTFGSGNWGVLGHGSEQDIRFDQPKLVQGLKKKEVVDVAMGEYHTLALTADGKVYTWGYGGKKGYFNWMFNQEVGALGHGDLEATFTPKEVKYFSENGLKVKRIAAGNYHCVVECDNGQIYNWGVGLYGVLGNGTNAYSLTPTINEEFQYMKEEAEEQGLAKSYGFSKLSAADDFTCALMKDGQILVWGKNDQGQMGVGSGIGIDLVESENLPKEVDLSVALPAENQGETVFSTQVSTGMRTMLVLDKEQRLFQTGLKIHWSPKLVNLNYDKIEGKIEQLACGRSHYVFRDTGNQLHVFGGMFSNSYRKEQMIDMFDGYEIYDGNKLFEGNKMVDLQMKYEQFGVLCEDQ